MELNYWTLGRIILQRRIVLSEVECNICGSRQRDSITRECVGCIMEKALGLSFKQIAETAWASNTNGSHFRFLSLKDAHNEKRRGKVSREQASRGGRQYYYGDMCDQCACNLRLTLRGRCEACSAIDGRFKHSCGTKRVICAGRAVPMINGRRFPIVTMHVDRMLREMAMGMDGEYTYRGAPCECGSDKRYTSRGQCVSCVTERNNARPAKKKTAPAQTGAAVEVETFDDLFD